MCASYFVLSSWLSWINDLKIKRMDVEVHAKRICKSRKSFGNKEKIDIIYEYLMFHFVCIYSFRAELFIMCSCVGFWNHYWIIPNPILRRVTSCVLVIVKLSVSALNFCGNLWEHFQPQLTGAAEQQVLCRMTVNRSEQAGGFANFALFFT